MIRNMPGNVVYNNDNQSFIDLMYKSRALVLSLYVMLPFRWLSLLLPGILILLTSFNISASNLGNPTFVKNSHESLSIAASNGDSTKVQNNPETQVNPFTETGIDPFTGNVLLPTSAQGALNPSAPLMCTITIDPDWLFSVQTNCNGSADGNIVFDPGGSIPGAVFPYTYDWDIVGTPGNDVLNDDGQPQIDSIPAGFYTIIVTDNAGCTGSATVEVENAPPIVITTVVANVRCFGGVANGSIQITSISGPPGTIIYDWDLVSTPGNDNFDVAPMQPGDDEDISGLVAGTYNLVITITDDPVFPSYTCIYMQTFVVTQPATAVSVSAPDVALACFGTTTPSITATGAGGTPGYTYNWSNLPPAVDPATNTGNPPGSGLGANNYVVTVTDANGCTSTDIVSVSQPASAVTATATGETVACNNNMGDIDLTPGGGTPGYTYLWSDGQMVQDPIGLNGGTYTVTVTDANGCTKTAQATITVSPPTLILPPPDGSTVECVSDAQIAPTPPPTNNSCGTPEIITGPVVSVNPACSGIKTYTYTYTEPVTMNSGQWVYTYTIDDNTPPTASNPPNITVACTGSAPPINVNVVTDEADNCSGPVTVSFISDVTSGNACAQTIVRTFGVQDACGNTINVTQQITVDPGALPTMTPSGGTTIACGVTPTSSTLPYSNSGSGTCLIIGTSNFSTFSSTPGACGGPITETWTATDLCGRALVPVTRIITVTPAPLPTMTAPGATTVACGAIPASSTIPFTNGGSGGCLINGTSNPSTFTAAPPGCGGTVTETWTATDACGRALAPVSRIITVNPAPLPTMTAPGATTVACGALPAASSLTYTNGGSGGCLITGSSNLSTFTSTPNACGGTVTETWTATDPCGRPLAPVSRIITINPAPLPTMTAPGASTVACGAIPAPSTITYTNGGSGGCLITGSSNLSTFTSTPNACGGTVTETWTATDLCGRALAPVSRIITVNPAPLPTMTAPGATTVACGAAPAQSMITYTNGSSGGCLLSGNSNLSTFTASPGACGGPITETWTATDACGRALAPVTRVITVDPAPLPTMTPPAAITVACGGIPAASTLPYTNGGSGGCLISGISNPSTFTITPPGCGGLVVETWTATDACGRALAPVLRVITVNPPPLPTMTPPGDITVACGAIPITSSIPFTNSGIPGCVITGLSNASTFTATPGACGGTVTETWTALDLCGRVLAPVSRVITVNPAPLPTMTAPGGTTIACGATPVASTITYTNGGSGGCLISGSSNSSTFTATPGICGGTITETWTATDLCGRALAPVTRIITVSPPPPAVFAAAPPITVSCGSGAVTSSLSYTNGASGACLISGSVTSTLSAPPGACGGPVTESWTFTDACGRTITQSRTITVDPAPPAVFAAAPPITVSCSSGAVMSSLSYTNGASGACLISGTVTSTLSAPPGPCGGPVTESWTFTDACGRTITQSRIITVDPAPPAVFAAAPPITVPCSSGAVTSSLSYTNGASGSCLISGTVTSTLSAPPGPCGGIVTESWTFTDACGRTITQSRVITVDPAPPPVFSAAPPITVACGGAVTSNLTYTNGGSGACLISGSVTSTLGSLPGVCGGSVTESWTFTDACGRTITQSRVITVDPAPPPVFAAAPPITVPCSSGAVTSSLSYTNGASGACLISGTITSTLSAPPGACGGPVTESWTFTDACGRTITQSRIITVSPAPPAVFAVAPPITVSCASGAVTSSLSYTNGASGPCLISGSVTSTLSAPPGACGGPVTETWTFTDACGRTITQSRIITVDPAPPAVFAVAPPITVSCSSGAVTSNLSYTNGASGACLISGTVTSTLSAPPGPCGGPVTESWTFTDACGRTITQSRIITVDPAPPAVFAAAPPITVPCSSGATTSSLSYTNGASGSCLISGTVTSTLSAPPGPCGGSVTESWTFTDACGRTITQSRVITVDPAPPPVFAAAPPITVACGGAVTSNLTYTNGGSGACLISGSVTSTLGSLPGVCGGSVTESWTFTDACGRTITQSRVITVDPAPLPVFAAAPPITVSCSSGAVTSSLSYTNGASGACLISGSVTSTLSVPPGACGGPVTESWTFTDACGRTITQSRIITVDPAPPPVFAAAPPITVSCASGAVTSSLSYTNGASGACLISGTVTSTLSAPPGACGGPVTESWTFTDACGRTITQSRIITVDPAPPAVFAAAPPITVSCASGAVTSSLSYTNGASGACLISGTVTSTLSAPPGACGGSVTESWTFTDACGRTITQSRIITVDPAPPAVFAAAPPVTVACGGAVTSNLSYTNGGSGACLISGSLTSTLSAPPGPCGGSVTESWTFTDACGRTITQSRIITVDPAAPAVFAAAPPITVSCASGAVTSSLSYTNGASGACLISGSVTSTLSAPPGACGGSVTESWTFTDACGRTITQSRVITVDPAPPPVFAVAPPITVSCSSGATTSSLSYTNGASGACLISGSVTSTLSAPPGACGGPVTESWTFTDACGRTITQSRIITVDPAPPPVFAAAPPITVSCGSGAVTSSLSYTNGASGACLISGTVTSTLSAPPGACGGPVTESWTFTDACGRTITQSRIITVDPAPPAVFAAAPPITVPCSSGAVTSNLNYTNGASGACLISGSVTSTLSAPPGACGGSVTESWTFTDACGRTITQSRIITVDPAPPAVFAAAPPVTVACGGAVTSNLSYTNGGSGACLISGTVTSTLSAPPGACGGSVTESWTFTDACGRTITQSRIITVDPAAPAVFAAAPPITVSCASGAVTSSLSYTNGGSGACLISGTVTSTLSAPPGACGGSITESWTFTDACGRTITQSRVITVDPAPPAVFDAAPPITVSCSSGTVTSSLSYTNGASGACLISGTVTSTLSAPPGACGGSVTESWTFTDACGRTITQSRVITVDPAPPPVFAAAPPITVSCASGAITSNLSYTNGASGACLISGTVTSTLSAPPGACGGPVTESWTFTDACGRTITQSRIITVDPAPPAVFAAAPSITVSCSSGAVTSSLSYTNGASGSCLISGTATSTLSAPPGPCGGSVTENWTFTDACGRTITQSRIITVDPAPPPVFAAAAPITVACGGAVTSSLSYTNGASGACLISGSVTSTLGPLPGACGGSVTESWTFTDACGRTIVQSRIITVDPAPPPVFAAAAPITVSCSSGAVTSSLSYTNGGSGACLISGTVTSTLSAPPGACGGSVTESWTFTDACGRTITQSRVITVDPAPPPVFAAAPPITVSCNSGTVTSSLSYTNGASGACLISGTVTSTLSAPPGACGGPVTESWTFTDACGRTITQSRIITVDPAPIAVFAAAPPITLSCSMGTVTSDLSYTNGASGACLISGTVTSTLSAPPGACGGSVTESWTFTDACGRTITQSRVITVDPATLPTLTALPDITIMCTSDLPSPVSLTYTNGGTGSCLITGTSNLSTSSSIPSCGGTVTETWTATDPCGRLLLPVTRVITIDAPTFVIPPPDGSTVACAALATAPTPPVVTDNCGNPIPAPSGVPGADPLCAGTKTWTFTFLGCDGAPVDWVYTYTINAPIVTLPPGGSSNVPCIADAVAPSPPTVTDNCNRPLTVSAGVPGPDPVCSGPKTWTFTYSACDATTYQWVYTYTIDPPTTGFPPDGGSTVSCISDAQIVPAPPTAVNSCGDALTVTGPVVGPDPVCSGTKTYTWTYMDCTGTSSQWVYTYTISPATFTLPANAGSTVACISDAQLTPTPPVASSTCGDPLTITGPVVGADPVCSGTKTYTWTYTDCSGNSAPWVYTYTINPPTFTLPPNDGSTVTCVTDAQTVPVPPSVNSSCGDPITPTGPVASPDPGCTGTKTYTWTYVDCAGNSLSWVYTYTVNAPMISLPPNDGTTVTCLSDAQIVPTPPTVNTTCSTPVIPTGPVISPDPVCAGTKSYTWTYTNCNGSSVDWTFTYTIPASTFTLPANDGTTVTCIGDAQVAPVPPTVTNSCGDPVIPAGPVVGADPVCSGTKVYTWTYTDCAGTNFNWLYTYTITGNTGPVFANPPANVTVSCIADVPSSIMLSFTDDCTPGTPVAGVDSPISGSCPATITRTWSFTDDCGFAATETQTITIDDTTPPTASDPAPVNLAGCNTAVPAPDATVVTDEADNCAAPVVAFINDVTTLAGCTESTTRTYSVTDACNNSIVVTQTITRTLDIQPPVLSPAPADLTVACLSQVPPMISLTYTDNCSPGGTLTGVETSSGSGPITITRTWTFTDACGNIATETQTILVDGVTPVTNIIDSFCAGDSYALPDGSTTTVGGSFGPYPFTTASGCDSLVNVSLTLNPSTTGNVNHTGCTGDGYSVVVNGNTYDESTPTGTETIDHGNANGCDSVVTINLVFNPEVTGNELYSGCEGDGYSVVVNGTLYNEASPDGTETLTSVLGCDSVVTINLFFAPIQPVVITPVGPLCSDAAAITLSVTPGGGTWSGAISSNQFDPSVLGPGSHQVIYTISQGACSDADTIQVVVYQMTLSCQAVTDESAPGANDGEGMITITGGVTPYSVQWNGPVSGSTTLNADGDFTITGLGGGVYTIEVEDASGCIVTCQFVINSNIPCLVVIDDIAVQNASCVNSNNGAISVTASGGQIPYEYSLDGITFQFLNVFAGLSPGNYTLFVRDATGCVKTQNFTIGVGPGPTITVLETINASCGIANGSVTLEGSNGQVPYSYSIDGTNYFLNGVFTNLNAGNYTGYLTDNVGCSDTITFSIIADGAPVINNIDVVDAACGQSNGSITVTATGGQGILMYSIDGTNFQTSFVFNGLPAGPYTVTVKDESDCSVTQNVNIQNANGPTIDNVDVVLASCGANDGQITITASGTPNLTYSINGVTYGPSFVFMNLAADSYVVYVKDGNGCVQSQPVQLNTTDGPIINGIVVVDTHCGNDDGEITINASGGVGELEYIINLTPYGDENHTEDWPAGVYDIIVQDENGCSVTQQVTIDPSVGPDLDFLVTPAHCGRADGVIDLDGFDGVPPYTYSINGAAGPFGVSFIFTGLVSDFYTVAIKDKNGCIHEEDVFLFEDIVPNITDIDVTDATCGMADGTITITATGIQPLEYSIALPFFQTSNFFSPVAPGTYTITVRDKFGCTDTGTATIAPKPQPIINNVVVVDTDCGSNNGTITIQANGGVSPLMYALGTGPFGPSSVFTGLGSGTYTVKVKGANGCEVSQDVQLSSTGAETSSISDSFCAGDDYTIAGNIYTLPGTYTITLTNGASNGCDSIITLTLTENPLKTKNLPVTICANEVYTINGTDYSTAGSYLIDTIPAAVGCDTIRTLVLTVNPLQTKTIVASICANEVYTINGIDYSTAGTYLIDTVSAAVGCDTIRTLDLSINPLEATTLNVSICNGEVYIIGNNSYSVTGQYVVDTLSAAVGCDSIRTLNLTVSNFIYGDIIESICQGDVYTINGVDYTIAGQYVIDTIVNPVSCDTIRRLNLSVDPLPTANAGIDQQLDCNVQSLVLNGTATGGTPHWTGADINAGNENLLTPTVTLPGTYYLTVTSPNNCVAIDSVVVTLDPSSVIATAAVDTFLSCDIDTVVLQAGPLGPNLTYQWSGPGINASNEHLVNPIVTIAGTYTLVVTNTVTNCVSLPASVQVVDLTTNIVAIIMDPGSLTCFSTFIDLETTGSSVGVNIAYIWFDEDGQILSSSPFLQVTSGGNFTFQVIDTISGCFDDTSVFIKDLQAYPPVVAGNPQQIDCNQSTVILNEGAINNLDNVIFHWTGPTGGILTADTLLSVTAGLAGEYFIFATDTVTGCVNSDSVDVIDLSQLPFIEIQLVQQFTCLDSIAMINVGASATGPDISYEWNGPQVNGVSTTFIETALPGMYYLTVSNDSTGCLAVDSILLELPDVPGSVQVDMTIPLCQGDLSGSLTVENVTGGTPVYMYSIDGLPFQDSTLFDHLSAGNHTLLVVDANGCSYSESFTIPDGEVLTINIGGDIELELGDSIELSAIVNLPWSQIDSIVWASGEHLSCTHCIDPTLQGLLNEIITATVYAGGCVDSDALSLRVDVDANVYIPNVFSPNHDDRNDFITVFSDHRVKRVVYLEIFDRWGNQVFVRSDFPPNDPTLGWDGTFKDKPMNPAVFAYIAKVELINGVQIPFKGDITLLR